MEEKKTVGSLQCRECDGDLCEHNEWMSILKVNNTPQQIRTHIGKNSPWASCGCDGNLHLEESGTDGIVDIGRKCY